jgi:hypothetical protein
MTDTISKEAFEALVKDRNLTLSPKQFEEMRAAYAHILAVRARLRTPRGFDAEPSGVFRPFA